MRLIIDASQIVGAAKLVENFRKDAPRLLALALNHAGDKAKTAATRETAKVMSLPVGTIREHITSSKANATRPIYEIVAFGKSIRLKEFRARPGAAGVSALIMGRTTIFRHTFIVPKLNAQVFKRYEPSASYKPRGGVRKHGLPIRVLSGPAVQQVFLDKRVESAVNKTIDEDLPIRIKHEIGRMWKQSK